MGERLVVMTSFPSRLRYGRNLVSSSQKSRSGRARISSGPFARIIGESRSVALVYLFCVNRSVSPPSSLPEIWGDDAHVFNPRRYLNRQRKEGVSTVGIYGDTLTFSTHLLLDSLLPGCSRPYAPLQAPAPVPALVGNSRESSVSSPRQCGATKTEIRSDSVIELHSLTAELLENFELSFPEGKTILRVPALMMFCMVEGEREKGVQMPIRLKPLIDC